MQGKILIFLGLLAVSALTHGIIGYKLYKLGQKDVQAKWDAATAAALDHKLDIKEKQDEIQNAPIDTSVTVRRLRNGTF